MKEKTLLIMAAGMGSRFGGLKQIEPIGPNGEFLIDYSIYDAIRAGYKNVVFIIKEENYEIFRDTIGKRVENKINVQYAFQKLENLPEGYSVPEGRVKPWGTAHAILCAKDLINNDFTIINADDFYGYDAYRVSSNFIENNDSNFCITGYLVKNVLSENGSVKRGVCITKDNYLDKLIESSVIKENGIITATPLDGSESFNMREDDVVSMNMLTFTPRIFNCIEDNFVGFLENNKDNLLKCEYLIPDIVNMMVSNKEVDVYVLPTTAQWYGVTYKEDKEQVVNNVKKLIKKGEYPNRLW